MRILWIVHPEADYGSSQLYNGFDLLRHEVYDWPAKLSYHGIKHRYSLKEPAIEKGQTDPLAWALPPWSLPCDHEEEGYTRLPRTCNWMVEDVKELIREGFFHLVVVESPRARSRWAWSQIESEVRAANLPILLHDGEDYDCDNPYGLNGLHLIKPLVWAVREKTLHHEPIERTPYGVSVPCLFAAPDQIVPSDEEWERLRKQAFQYETALLCGSSFPHREETAKALSEGLPFDTNAYIAVNQRLVPSGMEVSPDELGLKGYTEYIHLLRRSRTGVSVRGYGFDTCRFWEVAASTMLIADNLGIHEWPVPFVHGKHALRYTGASEALEQVKWAIANPSAVEDIAEEGFALLKAHHTSTARARQMIEALVDAGANLPC